MSKIIIKRPNEELELIEVDMKTDFLQTCYNIIDCDLIEIVPLTLNAYQTKYSIILDEEGKLKESTPNIRIWDGNEIIVGTCIIIKDEIDTDGEEVIYDIELDELDYIKKNMEVLYGK